MTCTCDPGPEGQHQWYCGGPPEDEPSRAERWGITDADTVIGTPPEVEALARSIEWLAVAQMLVLFHGRDRAWKRLQELGCPLVGNLVGNSREDGN